MKYGINYFRYSDELIEEMYKRRISGIPISFFLLDLRKTKSYCHHSSNIMAYLLGQPRITGNIDEIKDEDNSHSWVEKDGFVFDSTQGLVWNKDDYYRQSLPYNIRTIPNGEVVSNIKEMYGDGEVIVEVYIAMIKDMEDNLYGCPYKKYLIDHIKRFINEKGLDQVSFDSDLVRNYLKGLKEMYDEIEEFIK